MEVLAGAVCGFIMGVLFLGLMALMLTSLRDNHPLILRPLLGSIAITAVALPLAFLAFALWGLVGIFLGLLYRLSVRAFPGEGLGSPNLFFTLAISIFVGMATVLLLLTQRRALWERLGMNLAFLALFGWLLPLLAT